jgi:tetratricopeptide (TPR) repeat protein
MSWILAILLAAGMAAQDDSPSRRLAAARELKQRGAASESAKAYEALLPGARAAGDRNVLAVALLESGQLALAAGNYPRALERGEEATALFRGLQDPANEAWAANLAGSAELFRGGYEAALTHFQYALELDRRQHDAKGEINHLTNIANTYFYQGKYLDALQGYQNALGRVDENAREPWSTNRRQLALTNLAILYEQLGQNQRALDYYKQALAVGEAAMQPSEYGQLLSNAGTLYRRLGDAVKALESYRTAQKLFAREHLSDAEIHVLQNVGIALTLDLGDARGAEQAFSQALGEAQATRNRRETVLAHLFRGEAFYRAQRWDAAKADFAAALEVARAIGASEEEWTALYGVARIQRREGQGDAALATLREAIGKIESVRTGLGAASLKSDFLANKRDVYDAAIGVMLEASTRDAEALFRMFEQARSRNLQDALRGVAPPSLRAVQSRLGENLLFEYWIGDGKLAAMLVTKSQWSCTVRPWGAEDEAEAKSLVAAMRSGEAGWRERARKLGAALFGGVPRTTNAKHVLVVPDGVLYQIPFEVLSPAPGEPMLIETLAVSYLPSAALLMLERPRRNYRMPWQRQFVGFGDPLVDIRDALPGDERWNRLPESGRELESIADLLPGRTRIYTAGEDQKRFLFSSETAAAPLIHLATHAVADPNDANRSRILFTPEAGRKGSEYLFRGEVQGLALQGTDLVTLSACDTETGRLLRGEGVLSFSRAFLAAGARATVTTLWRVEDRATADFMLIFYRHLAAGEGKADALRAAKLSFLRQGGERAQPLYWAAFVLNGEGQEPIGPVISWWWVVGAVIGAVAFAVYRRRAR